MNKVKGLLVFVYRDNLGDCTNGGISSRYDRLILIGEGVDGPMTVDLDDPAENVVKLVKRRIFGNEEYLHVEPLDGCSNGGGKWYSYGGNLCYTSDSRFPNRYPLSIHDRRES